jgi:CBS domain-containing protein
MIENVISVRADQTVGAVMDLFEHEHIRSVPVTDEAGVVVGLFSLRSVLSHLLPAAATMEDGLQRLDFIIGAAPGVAKRLRKLRDKKVAEVMETNCVVAHEDTPTWEIVRLMAKHGSPLPVVDEKTGRLKAMVSSQTLLHGLQELLKEIDE